jgi:hypothetical protein
VTGDEHGGARSAEPVRTQRRVTRRWLVNALNRINFNDGKIVLTFRHSGNGSTLVVPARPGSCLGSEFDCTWVRRQALAAAPGDWRLQHFHLGDGLSRIEVPADVALWEDGGVRLTLPEAAFDVSSRRAKRHLCRGVSARLACGGGDPVAGRLEQSSASSFSVRVKSADAARPQPAAGEAVAVSLTRGATTIFAGRCSVIRSAAKRGSLTVVLRPAATAQGNPTAAASTRYRSLRPLLTPLPLIVFRHPFTGRQVTLRALDISGGGFSVEEEKSRAQLLPGLLLPRVRIEIASGFEFPCSARVIYNEPTPEGGLRSGLAIEAMSLINHTRLTALLHLGEYRNSSVCTPHVDLEELWNFFFETGFIYPEKYAHIKDQKAQFMRLYRNLYSRTPRIARHIIYQERGAIHGHVAMFRWYPTTWLLHHHAALTSSRHKAGLVVMEHMLRYINEFHRLFPQIMRYLAVYFRPNNRFAARAFGSAVQVLQDPGKCSRDAFASFHIDHRPAAGDLPRGWSLAAADAADRAALRVSYASFSGGLMLHGLALREEDCASDAALSKEYARLGFRRDRRLFALRREGACIAIIAANRSDLGLNLSDLTNGLQVFVLGPDVLPVRVLHRALAGLVHLYPPGTVPVLLYPRGYADAVGLAYDKVYDLTVLDLEHFGPYLKFMDALVAPPRTRPGAEPGPSR